MIELVVGDVGLNLSDTQHHAIAFPGEYVEFLFELVVENPGLATIEEGGHAGGIEEARFEVGVRLFPIGIS